MPDIVPNGGQTEKGRPPFWSIVTQHTPTGECSTIQSQEMQRSPLGIKFQCLLQRMVNVNGLH